jgi:hypothetical protein
MITSGRLGSIRKKIDAMGQPDDGCPNCRPGPHVTEVYDGEDEPNPPTCLSESERDCPPGPKIMIVRHMGSTRPQTIQGAA